VSCARPAKKLEGNAQWREYVALNNSVIQALLNATSQQQGDHRNARRIWPYMWSPNLRAGSPAVGLSRGGYPDRPRSVQCERRKGVGLPGVVRLHQCNRNPCDHTAQQKPTKATVGFTQLRLKKIINSPTPTINNFNWGNGRSRLPEYIAVLGI